MDVNAAIIKGAVRRSAGLVRICYVDYSLFDDDSIDNKYIPAVSMEPRAGDAAGASHPRLDPSNSALAMVHDRGYRKG